MSQLISSISTCLSAIGGLARNIHKDGTEGKSKRTGGSGTTIDIGLLEQMRLAGHVYHDCNLGRIRSARA